MNDNRLDPELLTIGELLQDSDAAYLVPIYQRNYAWQAEHIEQLLQDINDASCSKKGSYFLGNLMVTERQSAIPCFEVIDGQQRLTTLYLLLNVLAEMGLASKAHQDCLRYESRPRATEALRRTSVEASRRTASPADPSNLEDAGIHQGHNVIQQFLRQHVKKGESSRFAEFLLTKTTVVRACLPRKTDFNRYFEIMNTRGQQLQQADIIKARLMQQLADDAQRSSFAWIWEACSDMDSYVQMSLTQGDTTLRSRVFGDDWSCLASAGFDDLMAAKQQAGFGPVESSLQSTSLTLVNALEKYAKASTLLIGEDQDNVRFRSIIEFPVFLLHVLKIVNCEEGEEEGQLDDKHLIKLFTEALEKPGRDKSQWVRNFAFSLVRCRNFFDCFVLKRQYTATNSDEGDWSLQRLFKRVSKGQPTAVYKNAFSRSSDDVDEDGNVDSAIGDLLMLESMLRVTYTSPRTMHWITRLLRILDQSHMCKATESEVALALRKYAREKVRAAYPKDQEPTGFSISRIVFTYLDYLLWEGKPNPEFRFSFRNSIEHFYPQHPDEQQSGIQVSEAFLHRLGNLALVSVGANSKFSNSLPSAKAVNYQSTIEKQSTKLHLMAEITRKGEWSDAEVKKHHDAMIKLLRSDLDLF